MPFWMNKKGISDSHNLKFFMKQDLMAYNISKYIKYESRDHTISTSKLDNSNLMISFLKKIKNSLRKKRIMKKESS